MIFKVELTREQALLLIDLEQRLKDNYNNGYPFHQHEEDRLVVGAILDQITKGEN